MMSLLTSDSAGETLSREDVGLSSGSDGGGLLQSPMTMRHPAADLSPMMMRRPFSLEVDDSVMRAFRLSASCDMSSPQLEAGHICVKNLTRLDWNDVPRDLPICILVSVCNSVEKYTADTVGANSAYFYELSRDTDLGERDSHSSPDELVTLAYLGHMHRISQSRPFDPRFQGSLVGQSKSFQLRLPAPSGVLRPSIALMREYLGTSVPDPFEKEGNSRMSPSSYVFSSSPPNRSKRDDCSQQDPAGVWYEMRTKADAGKRCDKLMWVRRMADEKKMKVLMGRDMSFDAEAIWSAVHRECTEPGRISTHGKSVAFENAPLWSYLDQLAAFATVEMRQRALRMEFSRSNPISELSILHFQRGVEFGLSERLDCTILHRLTLVSCLEMLERTLITFYSEVFRGCMSGVISILSGMALSRSVCSNAFVTFVLDEALSIFGNDVANRSIEDFHTTTVFGCVEQSTRPLDYAGFLTATLQRLDFSDNAEKRFLKEVDHGNIVYTAGKRKFILGDDPGQEKVKLVKSRVAGKVLTSSGQSSSISKEKPTVDISRQCCIFFLAAQLGLPLSCRADKDCPRIHYGKGQCTIQAATDACSRFRGPLSSSIQTEISRQSKKTA